MGSLRTSGARESTSRSTWSPHAAVLPRHDRGHSAAVGGARRSNPSYLYDCPDCRGGITWLAAVAFCNAFSAQVGLTPAYTIVDTVVTWTRVRRFPPADRGGVEYACRAGTSAPFNTGACLTTDQANYCGYGPIPGCHKACGATIRRGPQFPANAWTSTTCTQCLGAVLGSARLPSRQPGHRSSGAPPVGFASSRGAASAISRGTAGRPVATGPAGSAAEVDRHASGALAAAEMRLTCRP